MKTCKPRPCPKLKRHRLGMACVTFKVNGRRRWVYFGPWGSRAAAAKYSRFARLWPWWLEFPHAPGRWPAERLITHDGVTRNLQGWARAVGLKPGTLAYRLDVLNWPVGRAITTPARGKARPQPKN